VDWPAFTALQQVEMARCDDVPMSKYIVIENGCMDRMRELVDESTDILSDDNNDTSGDHDNDYEQVPVTITVPATPQNKAHLPPLSMVVYLEPEKRAEPVRYKASNNRE